MLLPIGYGLKCLPVLLLLIITEKSSVVVVNTKTNFELVRERAKRILHPNE